jgi:hypothetical protein
LLKVARTYASFRTFIVAGVFCLILGMIFGKVGLE